MRLIRLLPICVLLLGLAVVLVFAGVDYLSVELLKTQKENFKKFIDNEFLVSVVVFILVYSATTACSIPGAAILSLLGGYLYGVFFGTIFSLTGATVGACVVYFAARTALGDILKSRAGSAVITMQDGFKRNAFYYMLFLRLVPIFPFFLVNLVPAFLRVRFTTYFFASVIGMFPGSLVFSLTGVGLDKVLLNSENVSIASLVSEELMFGLLGLGVLSISPVIYKWIVNFIEKNR
jgi:uncharacterized membrane protein YdjX (TVP38/TMEM64 family)